jgi:hypothetical protein
VPAVFQQVVPFVAELSVCFGNLSPHASTLYAPGVEIVAASFGLGVHSLQVCGYRGKRGALLAETDELWMVNVALRPAGENSLGEKRLAPQGDKALSVKVARMYGPESHGLFWI